MLGHSTFDWSGGCLFRRGGRASITALFPFAFLTVEVDGQVRSALLPSPLLWPLELAVWFPWGDSDMGWSGAYSTKFDYLFLEFDAGEAPVSVLEWLGLLCWFSPLVLYGIVLIALSTLWVMF